jgi:uncharacterized membrane protein YeaQ/YmgE (transglycosylase-associated protein family)
LPDGWRVSSCAGGGLGLLGDIVVDVLGALCGGLVLSRLLPTVYDYTGGFTGFNLGSLLVALIGAVLLLVIVRVFSSRRAPSSTRQAPPERPEMALPPAPGASLSFSPNLLTGKDRRMQTTIRTPQRMVREYTSSKAFRRDARQLYKRTGYTVSQTTGLAHTGLIRRLAFLGREFGWPRQQRLVITYSPPSTPRPAEAGGQ